MLTSDQIKKIADEIEIGFKCYLKNDCSRIIFLPDEQRLPGIYSEEWADDIKEIDENVADYIEISDMQSHQYFNIMEDFIDTLQENNALRLKLQQTLAGSKPFRNFKFQIDNSGKYRADWYTYKRERLYQWVVQQIPIRE